MLAMRHGHEDPGTATMPDTSPHHDDPGTVTAPHPSAVTAIPAARPEDAARHFAARLAFETDVADVGAAVAAGEPDFVLVDVRSRDAFAAGHIPGAISLPHREIDAARAAELPDGLLVVYCWGPGCNAAQHGGHKLSAEGRQVKEMIGGWEYYVREGWPTESGSIH
jgi:rhodanese-related sulfurtransferase